MDLLSIIEQDQMKTDMIEFRPGDTVRVHVKLIEGNRQRIQVFEGAVIGIHKGKARSTFTVRKVSYGVGVERIFPLHSRIIDKIEVVRRGRVRRAKLFYLRKRVGKKARIKELRKSM
jgi:large subunit ribosomal protein L19